MAKERPVILVDDHGGSYEVRSPHHRDLVMSDEYIASFKARIELDLERALAARRKGIAVKRAYIDGLCCTLWLIEEHEARVD